MLLVLPQWWITEKSLCEVSCLDCIWWVSLEDCDGIPAAGDASSTCKLWWPVSAKSLLSWMLKKTSLGCLNLLSNRKFIMKWGTLSYIYVKVKDSSEFSWHQLSYWRILLTISETSHELVWCWTYDWENSWLLFLFIHDAVSNKIVLYSLCVLGPVLSCFWDSPNRPHLFLLWSLQPCCQCNDLRVKGL